MILLFVALILGLIAIATSVTGMVIPYWLYNEKHGLELHEGLWEICVKQPTATQYVCTHFSGSDVTTTVRAVWALEIMGVVLVGIAQLLTVLKLTVLKQLTVLPYVSGIMQMFAGICIIVGSLLYMLTVRDEKDPTHRNRTICKPLYVTIGGGGAVFVFAIFFFAAARMAINPDKKESD